MATAPEQVKSELIERAAGQAGSGEVADLVRAYYRHVAPPDVVRHSAEELLGIVESHLTLAAHRPQGTELLQVDVAPVQKARSVVEVVTDDMPFLVDSVTMELARQGRSVHLVVHPRAKVERDVTGGLVAVSGADASPTAPPVRGDSSTSCVESWIRVEVDQVGDVDDAAELKAGLERVLRDVREAVEDWGRMLDRAKAVVTQLEEDPPDLPDEEIRYGKELLTWLVEDHFTFLGYREYLLEEGDGDSLALRAVPGTGLGILRSDPDLVRGAVPLRAISRAKARDRTLLVLTKANSRATVHRPAYLDYVGVKTFDDQGRVVGERRFLGLLSSRAYTESIMHIPLLKERAAKVLELVGIEPHGHGGKALIDTLETFPRDELFHTSAVDLAPVAESVLQAGQRRDLRAFLRRDTYGRYVSVLVYLPRDRYTTAVREKFSSILSDMLEGEEVEFNVRVSEQQAARVHFVVHPPADEEIGDFDEREVEQALAEASRSWRDDIQMALVAEHGAGEGKRLLREWGEAFPEGYKERYDPDEAVRDLEHLLALDEDGVDLRLLREAVPSALEARLKVYRRGGSLSLSQVLPLLASTGVEVVDERPYALVGRSSTVHVYEFRLRLASGRPYADADLFTEALLATWRGHNEVDGFNALVLDAGVPWRDVTWLRACAKYLKQGSTPFSYSSLVGALRAEVEFTRGLVRLFAVRFDPAYADGDDWARATAAEEVEAELEQRLDAVVSLDHDRILRAYLALVLATSRTNFHRPADDGGPRSYIAFKFDPSRVPGLPEPKPTHEIFVYSPRVEGVHLRFGTVARGGLRWSDRRDDYRTEVLGLVKAQMVKNTVIVPVGAKGGFVAKQLPDASDREAWQAEGLASYRTFIAGLLDVTDNLVDGEVVPPPDVVRHDGEDSYLVVAADKGTASFSDEANELAQEYGFWLGDAFASGGSVGYDHKGMGITARGAWVSVQRHFRERGIDCQREEFTCVGIGDMSGDVFGNGMLRSETTRLVAAFDHRDIFVDPDPDAAASYAERRRLFELPRSSWQDYDRELISSGGGVFSRTDKSVPVSEEMRSALGIEEGVDTLSPNELISAVLRAPVDLLWNGGIGTYVKASTESHGDVGDKANDAIRVDGRDLRAKCVGEGGNLGLTQLGRIEYARTVVTEEGETGRVNTDAIDNSAGVDTSDHEVNIKILLQQVVAAGELAPEERPQLLASMTDEVAGLVLRDNYEQNLTLASALATAPQLLHVHEEWVRDLEARGVVNRELEGLPSRAEVRRRLEAGEGLCAPELAVLMAWTKIVLADELLDSDLPDDPYLRGDLIGYFPSALRQDHRAQMDAHPLRREITTTRVVNDLVNSSGITYWTRLAGETGADAAELTRANLVAREIFGAPALWREFEELDNQVPADVQTTMRIAVRTLVERASRWLVTHHRPPLPSEQLVDELSVPVQRVMGQLPDLLLGAERGAYEERCAGLVSHGVPQELAARVAVLEPAYALLGVVTTATREQVASDEVAALHLTLGERVGLTSLAHRIAGLPRPDRWQAMARAALRDDLQGLHVGLTAQVLRSTDPSASAAARVEEWETQAGDAVARATDMVTQVLHEEKPDLARLSVGVRLVRGLQVTATD